MQRPHDVVSLDVSTGETRYQSQPRHLLNQKYLRSIAESELISNILIFSDFFFTFELNRDGHFASPNCIHVVIWYVVGQ